MPAERVEVLINALQNGGNTSENRTKALKLLLKESEELTTQGINDLSAALELGWRRAGEVPDELLDTSKISF